MIEYLDEAEDLPEIVNEIQHSKRKYIKSDPTNFEKALASVQDGSLKVHSAAKKFNVSKTSLRSKLNNPQPKKWGTSPMLEDYGEEILVKWIIDGSLKGEYLILI